MIEVSLYPEDMIQLEQGNKIILYDTASAKPIIGLILEKEEVVIKCNSKLPELPTETVDNPVSKL